MSGVVSCEQALIERLGVLDECDGTVLPQVLAELRWLLRGARAIAYAVVLEPAGFSLDFAYSSGFALPHEEIRRLVARGVEKAAGEPWALYDPRRPSAEQRNRVVTLPPRIGAASSVLGRLRIPARERERFITRMQRLNGGLLRRIGMDDMAVCRVVLCDGPAMLAWLGVARSEPFEDAEAAILQRMTPALVRRLSLERKLASASFQASALPVVLDAIAAEALIVDAGGAIRYANAAARHLRRETLQAELYDWTEIASPGMPKHFLAIRRRNPATDVRITLAAQRWGLTARQQQVLELLLRGEPTKTIAASLGCAERTVESHITRILDGADVSSRAALLARFWS